MRKTNASKPGDTAEQDFGLEGKYREYHDHGGARGDARAKELEGDIGSAHARHDDQLKKGRPDGSAAHGK